MKNRNRIIRHFFVFFSGLILQSVLVKVSGQVSSVSGIVNTYHSVIEIIPAKACIRLSSTAGLSVNKPVLLIQMKGASITTSNNSTYGTVTSLNDAGNYETGIICAISGDSVFLFHMLQNTYTPSTGKVQLIPFASYISAIVTDTIKASPWNNSTGTGGVIALYAEQNLELNAPVYAGAAGFSGGNYLLSNGTCSDFSPANGYVYNSTTLSPQNGAAKGESIADLTSTQAGGRGSPANGGGGGNNHNNSGGGGANLSAGGTGGGNSSSGVACTATLKGEAGKALSSNGGMKIFAGGGGGAGHSNNGLSNVSGAAGGGIIFIWASSINGNGYPVIASGGNGGSSISDGAGGGGGGGTIIMHVTNYSGALSVIAEGGNGGNSNDGGNIGRCFGGGGGGSGGVIYFTGAIPAITTSVNAGAAGLESARDASCNPVPQAASAGSTGQIIDNYTFTRSGSPAGYCSLILASHFISFTVTEHQHKVNLEWTVAEPEYIRQFEIERKTVDGQWKTIGTIAANSIQQQYLHSDQPAGSGYILYRIRMISQGLPEVLSTIRSVLLTPEADYVFSPNPASHSIQINRTTITPATLKLTDISGRIYVEKPVQSRQINLVLPELPVGIYLLNLDGRVKKLLIQ